MNDDMTKTIERRRPGRDKNLLDEVAIRKVWITWEHANTLGLLPDAIADRASEMDSTPEERAAAYLRGDFDMVIPIAHAEVEVACGMYGSRTVRFQSGLSLMPVASDDLDDLENKTGAAFEDLAVQLRAFGVLGDGETFDAYCPNTDFEEPVRLTPLDVLQSYGLDTLVQLLSNRMTPDEQKALLAQDTGREAVRKDFGL